MKANKPFNLSTHSIFRLEGKVYDPKTPKKFIYKNGCLWENMHEPSELMMLSGLPENEPSTILQFLLHLVNNKYERYVHLINWIACCYAFGIQPKTALILFGIEGAGKGLLHYIMTRLYGVNNCSQINAASFKSQYNLAKELENKRFINFDEMTMKISEREEGLFKAVTVNPDIVLGRKIELHAQCLFTANYSTVFKIPDNGRRYTVFQTGDSLESTHFLGFGCYEILLAEIESELADFSKYLKNYSVDVSLANTSLDTEEKQMIIAKSKNHIMNFYDSIINLRIEDFISLQYRGDKFKNIYKEMHYDMIAKGRVNRAHLKIAYEGLYGDSISTVTLMNLLREHHNQNRFKNYIFEPENIISIGGKHYIYPKGV